MNTATLIAASELEKYRLKVVKPVDPKTQMAIPDNVDAVMRVWEKSFLLTSAEMLILEMAVREEHSMTAIAKKRRVTTSTVKKQIRSLLKKTGDTSLGHAALRVLREAFLMQ